MPPINLASAAAAAPADLPGVTVNDSAPPPIIPSAAVAPVPVGNLGVSASPMPAVAAAGVQLAKIVLTILAGSLIALVGYLWTSDWRYASNLRLVYDKVVAQTAIGTEVANLDLVEKQIKLLRDAAKDPQSRLSPADEKVGRELIAALAQAGGISDQQKSALEGCIPAPPENPSRAAALGSCAEILEGAKKVASGGAATLDRARLLVDFAKHVNEHRQSFHTSWFQEAQLILLNLLLPLLTGLFGYIFGTQQAQSQKPGS